MQYGGMTPPRDSTAVLSAPSSEPPIPDSAHTALAHSAFPLPEPKVSDCKLNLVHWPFERVSVFRAVSPCFSWPDVFWALHLVLVLWAG